MVITNDTLRFILPMLYTPKFNNIYFVRPNLVGVFTGDVDYPEMDDKLLLVYQDVGLTEDSQDLDTDLTSLPNFFAKYTHEGDGLTVYALDIPERFEEDYVLYLQEQFDGLSPELKTNIVKFWNLEENDNLFKILTGTLEYDGEPIDKQLFIIDEYDKSIDFIDKLLERQGREELEFLS